MSSPTIDYALSAQEKSLDALKQSQAAVVEIVDTWAKAVEKAVEELPAIPVAASLPTIDEIVKTSFDYADRLLGAQREFAQKLAAASAPAIKTTPVAAPVA